MCESKPHATGARSAIAPASAALAECYRQWVRPRGQVQRKYAIGPSPRGMRLAVASGVVLTHDGRARPTRATGSAPLPPAVRAGS